MTDIRLYYDTFHNPTPTDKFNFTYKNKESQKEDLPENKRKLLVNIMYEHNLKNDMALYEKLLKQESEIVKARVKLYDSIKTKSNEILENLQETNPEFFI